MLGGGQHGQQGRGAIVAAIPPADDAFTVLPENPEAAIAARDKSRRRIQQRPPLPDRWPPFCPERTQRSPCRAGAPRASLPPTPPPRLASCMGIEQQTSKALHVATA